MEDYSSMAKPEKVWCLLNGSAGHEAHAAELPENSQYRSDIEGLIDAKTNVAKLLVEYYSGSDDSVERVKNIEIPYPEALPEENQDKAQVTNQLLNSAESPEELLIAGRDAVSLYQESIGYEIGDQNIGTKKTMEDNLTGAYERVENLIQHARDQSGEEIAEAINLSFQNVSKAELRDFAEESRWQVNPKKVDAVDLRIWSREQLEGPPFTEQPSYEEIANGTSNTQEIEHAWEII